LKRKYTDWGKIFANHIPDKVSILKIHHKKKNSSRKKIYKPILKMSKGLKQTFAKRFTNGQ
jgi:hypothetical protein